MEQFKQNLDQILAQQTAGQPPSDDSHHALDQFLVEKVWIMDQANDQQMNSQALIVVNCGEFKIVQNEMGTEIIPLPAIISVSRTANQTTADGSNVFGFKLCYIDDLPRYTATFGVRKKTSRDLWMNTFATELVSAHQGDSEFLSLHQCYLNSAQTWMLAWVLVTENRRLVFYNDTGVVADVDLRKMRSLEWDTTHLVLSHPNQVLKIRIFDPTFNWRQSVLNLVSSMSDQYLENQMLDGKNIPVIVAKCLNYIFVHGITSEGIYRKSGGTSKVKSLLKDFAKNPFDVSIRPEDYTEHDVASALRKFLRGLSEPVVGNLGARFSETAQIENDESRIEDLKMLILELSEIRYSTLREIVRHLYFIQTQQSVNKMTTQNLAIVWGNSLLGDTFQLHRDEVVLGDFIDHKDVLFNLLDDDLVK
jgi:RhoGAP domain